MTFHRLKVCTLFLFFFLSGLDLGLTFLMLRLGGERFFESNPLAGWALHHAGWLGLTSFKTGSVMTVVASCFTIATWRPRLGNRLLSFACALLLIVVGYSSALAGSSGIFCPHAIERHSGEIEQQHALLKKKVADAQAYAAMYKQVWAELLTRRAQIPEAADRLALFAQAHQLEWATMLQARYPGLSLHECLEAHLQSCLRTALRERWPLIGVL
jgi:hypothetical protein